MLEPIDCYEVWNETELGDTRKKSRYVSNLPE